jgi:hypothetical protein
VAPAAIRTVAVDLDELSDHRERALGLGGGLAASAAASAAAGSAAGSASPRGSTRCALRGGELASRAVRVGSALVASAEDAGVRLWPPSKGSDREPLAAAAGAAGAAARARAPRLAVEAAGAAPSAAWPAAVVAPLAAVRFPAEAAAVLPMFRVAS